MAKGKNKKKRKIAARAASSAVSADAEADVGDAPDAAIEPAEQNGGGRSRPVARRADQASHVGGVSIYKPGQGYYTRMGTAIGAGILLVGLGNFMFGEMEVYVDPDTPWTLDLQLGVPFLVVVALGVLVYWLVGKNHRTCDFLILTEGEMKKVSWSTTREVVGSTKVVIFVVIAMTVLLFCVDYVFMRFFRLIGVLGG